MTKKVVNLQKKQDQKKQKRKSKTKVKPDVVKDVQCMIMMGNIGTGKTTAAMQLVKDHGFYRVSHDDLSHMMRGYDYDRDDVIMYHEIENMMIGSILWYRKDIVIDRTNMTRVDRLRWVELFKHYNEQAPHINLIIKVMDFGRGNDESLERVIIRETNKMVAKADPKTVNFKDIQDKVKEKWEKVYGFMYNGYEAPTLDEGMAYIKDMVTGDIYEPE